MTFDPRKFGTPVYHALSGLRKTTEQDNTLDEEKREAKLKKQKSMAQELYTYLSTWGLMRLKAEELILTKKDKDGKDISDGREKSVQAFFTCLEQISGKSNISLNELKTLDADEYLGLTGLGLELAHEFSFWVSAIYHDVKGEG